jgi:hypothetical protein
MRAIEVDMKRDPMEVYLEALVTGDPSRAIMNQEKRGQGDLIRSEVLPRQCPRADLETLGFVFGQEVDDLFIEVKFPAGWKKVATEHSMWTDLVDDKGRKRGGIFYKAAFYDRSAHMHLNRRYSYGTQPINGYGDGYSRGDAANRRSDRPGKRYLAHRTRRRSMATIPTLH